MPEDRGFSLILIPEGGQESRTWRITGSRLRLMGWLGALLALMLLTAIASWFYLASRAREANRLQREVTALRAEQTRVASLARQLQDLERRYEGIREMFGSGAAEAASPLWLPPTGSGGSGSGSLDNPGGALPSSWPLTERGFVTQSLLESTTGTHPGIDIAISTGSYIRASGAGTVVEAGEDETYGLFLVLDHGNGYRTRYAHASTLFVEEGRHVRQHEVIGLSGSSGRSTAPHLHFEVLRNGEAVDPLSLVRQP